MLLICASAFLLMGLPADLYSQTPITELGLQNLLDISIDITITFDDNSTFVVTIPANDDALIAAPTGKEITELTAGTKTVDLPMDPTTQTGWNIPGTPPGQDVTATARVRTMDHWWFGEAANTPIISVSFSY